MSSDRPTLHLVDGDDSDRELTRALRALYQAPEAAAYWGGLEQRIIEHLTRETAESEAWWVVPAQWTRIGLIAAGFALIVAASLFLRTRADERQMAYDSVLGTPAGGPTTAMRDAQTEQQAAFNVVNPK